jgi:hypothetical protein
MSTPTVGASAPAASSASAPATSPTPSASAPKTSSAPSPASSVPAASSSSGGGDPGGDKINAQGPIGAAQTPAEVKEEMRKLKGKVNGREVEWTEAEAIRRAQLADAADEKFREAAEMRKQAEQFFELLRTNPKQVLLHPEFAQAINLRELAEEYLGGELQRELMDPKDRELEELRKFKQEQEEARQRTEHEKLTKAQQAELREHQIRAAKEIDRQLTDVLSKADLPKDPEVVKRVAELMYQAGQKGYELDAQTAVDIVRDRSQQYLQSLTSKLDGESLVKFLGDDLVKKIRKHDLARIKAQLEGQQPAALADAQQQAAPSPAREEKPALGLRPDEWRKNAFAKWGM